MLEENLIQITSIEPAPRKRGRPAGVKNKPKAAAKPRKVKGTPKMQNPKKTESFAVGVSPQHYWLITALAESRNVPRMEILDGILHKFVATISETIGEKA